MLTTKRVLITTICGLIFGIICMFFAMSNPEVTQPISVLLTILLTRTMMGFTIGVSALRMNWWLHGIFWGFLSSLPMFSATMDNLSIAIGSVVMGIIYGFLTELIVSVFFKVKSVGA